MLAAEEVPVNFNESRETFYKVLDDKSLFFAAADFDKDTWKVGTLNKKSSWKPATKIWVKFVPEAASGDAGKRRGKTAVEELPFSVDTLKLTVGNYGHWWGLAKASSLAVATPGAWTH